MLIKIIERSTYMQLKVESAQFLFLDTFPVVLHAFANKLKHNISGLKINRVAIRL